MQLVLHVANVVNDPKNSLYPNKVVATSAAEMKDAIKKDHVCASYADDRRSNSNFLESNVLVMDCDNDHSDDPSEWVTPEKLEALFPDISYAIAFSRNHMKAKAGKSERPRLHVYFEIGTCKDPDVYAGIKRAVWSKYPFFDENALDAARFIFGADTGDVIWHEGWTRIDDTVSAVTVKTSAGKTEPSKPNGYVIPEGSRNSTLSRFAAKVLTRLGNTESSYEEFLKQAEKCDPPLPKAELNEIWKSALSFYEKKVVPSKGYLPPEKYATMHFHTSLLPEDYTDLGEAKVLRREYGSELMYSNETHFLRYDGISWIENDLYAMGAIFEFLDLQLADAKEQVENTKQALIKAKMAKSVMRNGVETIELMKKADDEHPLVIAFHKAEAYYKFAMLRRDYNRISATANTVKPMISVDVNDLDKDAFLLNTPDGTYNLRLGVAGSQPHDPSDLITKKTACSVGDDGKTLWLNALDTFFCKNQELIDYVQQVVGLAAIGKVLHEHLIIAYGNGANGKSTFWNAIARVMGDYSGDISAEILTTTKSCRNVKPEIAELRGRRLVIASELEEGTRLNTGIVKQLCSVNAIVGEKKYKNPFSFLPSHTLVLYTNHLPKVGANDDGTWRRMIVVPFDAKITGSSDIKNYTDFLFEHAGPFILKWIIEGAQKVINNDYRLEAPAVVTNAIEAYRAENDWLAHFLSECCDTDPVNNERSGQLYQSYRAYCTRTGDYIRSNADFNAALEHAGFERRKTKTGSIIYGLKLRDGQDFL